MKKKLLVSAAVLLVAVLAAGGALWYSYAAFDSSKIQAPAVTVQNQALQPEQWSWQQPIWGGLLTKQLYSAPAANAVPHPLGTLAEEAPRLALALPGHAQTTLQLHRGALLVYEGPAENYTDEHIRQDGEYTLAITCRTEAADGGSGTFVYRAAFTVALPAAAAAPASEEPALLVGSTELQQGDVLALRLVNLPNGVTPAAETILGMANFLPAGSGRWDAAIPIGNTREAGEYTVLVTAGALSWQVTATVQPFAFDRQDLTIDTSVSEIAEANSPEAIQQYNNVILAMRRQYDEVRYWEDVFVQPAAGRISTNFGAVRVTNGDESTARPHWGMDIANAEGTPIYAPNNGRVAFADYLLAVGWTIIIEHGGGLKSYMFHMSELYVEEGQMVATGDHIGAMGSTGYSTGSHLHYETRIGDQAISPQMLFKPTAGLYSAGAETEAAPQPEPAAQPLAAAPPARAFGEPQRPRANGALRALRL